MIFILSQMKFQIYQQPEKTLPIGKQLPDAERVTDIENIVMPNHQDHNQHG